jgi:hypothetical protein
LETSRNARVADPRLWSAYAVGHHPHSLWVGEWQLWLATAYNVGAREELWEQIVTDMEEIKEAISTLAAGEQISSPLLAELLLMLTEFESICRDAYDQPWTFDRDQNYPAPGYPEWRRLVKLSAGAVGPSEQLSRCCQLGEAVGQSQYQAWNPDPSCDDIPPAVATIPVLLQGLGGAVRPTLVRAGLAAVREINKPASIPSLQEYVWRARERRRALARLDLRLRSALRGRVAQEPLLVLDAKTITFFGSTRPLILLR